MRRLWANHKQLLIFLVIFVAFTAVLGAAGPVFADHNGTSPAPADAPAAPATPTTPPGAAVASDAGDSTIASVLTAVVMNMLIPLLGKLLTVAVSGVVKVSQYNDFINSLAVVNGWVIVRDVANMFFIVVLLIIAFGTILGQEEYHYKKLLPKMLILAVLVNFSRTIVGVMIDFAQVIMLTFVNGYQAAAGGNFANIFQIVQLLQFNKAACPGAGIGDWMVLGAAVLALIMIVVSIITVAVILAVLVLRIITLWLLTVLSPLAFLAGTFPQGQKYYAQWWEEFKNNVMVGPMLAFFLWLSLITVGSGNAAAQLGQDGHFTPEEGEQIFATCSAVGGTDAIISFVIGNLMLLAGVQMAQSMGGTIAGIAGQAKSAATRALKFGAKSLAAPFAFGAGYGALRLDDYQARLQQKFAKSRFGAILPHAVREKISEHGIALRTVPEAWKLRSSRVEKERLGESMAVAYDLMNRYVPMRTTKSDFTEIERGGDVQKKMTEYAMGGEDHERLRNLLYDMLDNKGVVKHGKEKDAESLVLMMAKNHDFNEILKDNQLSKMVMGLDQPAEVTAENAAKLIIKMFGGGDDHNQEGLRMLNKVGDMGFHNSDSWLFKISEKDAKSGEYKLNLQRNKTTGKFTEDSIAKHGEIAAGYTAKLGARANSTNTRGQNIFVERADESGNRVFTDEIHPQGEQWLKKVLPAMSGHLQYMQPEFINAILPTLHKLFDFSQRSDLSQYQKTGIETLVKKLMNMKAEASMPERSKVVEFAMQSRDELSYQQIADSRKEPYTPLSPDPSSPTSTAALTGTIVKTATAVADTLRVAGKQAEAELTATAAAIAGAAAEVGRVAGEVKKVADLGNAIDAKTRSAQASYKAAVAAHQAAQTRGAPQSEVDSLRKTADLQRKILQAVKDVGDKIKTSGAASAQEDLPDQAVSSANSILKQYATAAAQAVQAHAGNTGKAALAGAAQKIATAAQNAMP